MQAEIQKNLKLLAIRDAAAKRLSRFANSRETEIKHSYLFKNDQFAGVRYRIGAFVASWFCGEEVVCIYRGENLIDQVALQAAPRKAA